MSASKRKADALQRRPVRDSKKLKSTNDSADETPEDVVGKNDCKDDHQYNDAEPTDEATDRNRLGVPTPMQRRSHRAMTATSKAAKQRLLHEQVDFIILTRDNFQPDPPSMHSTTHGPLPWPAVAKLYNQKYGLALTPAAMEKRARQHRSAWLAEHPNHPRQIVYAKKVNGVSQVRPPQGDVEKKTSQVKADVGEKKSARFAGWLPPDDVRNWGDINNYIHHPGHVTDSEHVEWISIEVVDAEEFLLGNVQVRLEDIRKSSAWYRQELEDNTGLDVQLRCSSVAVVERYVQYISAVSPFDLPEDLALQMELYSVAAQLQDQHVCDLVMACWRNLSEQDTELELDPDDVNNLFHSTEHGDPARDFWAAAIHDSGVGDQLLRAGRCHSALAAKIEELARGLGS